MYENFFDLTCANAPYRSEAEYECDIFSFVDIALYGICVCRGTGVAGQVAAELDLSAVMLPAEEALCELNRRACGGAAAESADIAVMRRALQAAEGHILCRLAFTLRRGADFALERLALRLHLSKAEKFVFLLVAAATRNVQYGPIFELLQGAGKTRPTIRLALSLAGLAYHIAPAERAQLLSLNGTLFEYLVFADAEPAIAAMRMLSLPRRMARYLNGEVFAAPEAEGLLDYCFREELTPLLIRSEYADTAEKIIRAQGSEAAAAPICDMLHIYGEDGNGKLLPLKHAARRCGLGLVVMKVAALAEAKAAEIEAAIREMKLECWLTGAVPCFVENMYDAEMSDAYHIPFPPILDYLIGRVAAEFRFCAWVTHDRAAYLTRYPLHAVGMEVPMLTASERVVLWNELSKGYRLAAEIALTLCANQYILTIKGICAALHTAEMLRMAAGDEEILRETLIEAVRQQSVNQLGSYATLINAVFTWDDLVIDEEQKWQMKLICDQVRYRSVVGETWGFHSKTPYGGGICAMFFGSPGTGKTMAVQVMANELGLDLYRVDLSQMVSKYIGETEKNISDLFKRAKNINALLFFDEADSMFAKRSEVKDAQDRNANAETAHLLQKLEDYSGITILATNFANNIDDAFKRRIKFMVNFTFPPPEVRLQLWTTILPPQAALDEEIDFKFFADSFELSGSSIKEVLTSAAYMAAAAQRGIRNEDIVRAVRLNFGKYGKVLTPEDFGYLGGSCDFF